jgi:hypothetical protein
MPFLLLHGTLWNSVVPVGIQSYLNLIVLIPGYFVLRTLPPQQQRSSRRSPS